MAITLKAMCSECLTTHYAKVEFGQENLKCPACGHMMKNLPEGELNEMDTAQKAQRFNQIIALAAFGVGAAAFFAWVFGSAGGDPTKPPTDFLATAGWPALTVIGLLASIVFGALGSRLRYIVEF